MPVHFNLLDDDEDVDDCSMKINPGQHQQKNTSCLHVRTVHYCHLKKMYDDDRAFNFIIMRTNVTKRKIFSMLCYLPLFFPVLLLIGQSIGSQIIWLGLKKIRLAGRALSTTATYRSSKSQRIEAKLAQKEDGSGSLLLHSSAVRMM